MFSKDELERISKQFMHGFADHHYALLMDKGSCDMDPSYAAQEFIITCINDNVPGADERKEDEKELLKAIDLYGKETVFLETRGYCDYVVTRITKIIEGELP